ncbi:WD40/YVTN/BNR-like repeat-containing protein [Flexivirga alba]|uniref:WD40/YVTN/BNR-like repeat-containing protein n=1 Tax=Flexivirga alba TaxID=702742 RepID=A0ABW2AED0_9MICO
MSDVAIQVLVGTTKGTFILDGDADRSRWAVRGPYCDGWPINHVIGDPATGTMWAGGGGDWSGAGVWRSNDGGATWDVTKLTTGEMDSWAANDPEFAESIGWTEAPVPFGDSFSQVWSLGRSGGKLYAGTKPATLLVSDDDGETWQTVKGLTDHPSAPDWGPGAAGLVLHTIVVDPEDPEKMWIGISAAGVFATEDGGVTWERRNDLADPTAGEGNTHPAAASDGHTGFCVHHLERAAGRNPFSTNRITTVYGARRMAATPGTTSPRACPRRSASHSGRIRVTAGRSGPCRSTATARAATHRMRPPLYGAPGTPVLRGRRYAPGSRKKRASSPCCARA